MNFVEYGVDKITNTYVFSLNAYYLSENEVGNFLVTQNYRGLGLQQEDNSFRDDESFSLEYSYPLTGSLFAVAETNWFYSSDTRTTGNNELNKLNGIGGLKYIFPIGAEFQFLAGYEQNKQLSVQSPGLYMKTNAELENFRFTNHNLNLSVSGEYLSLNLDRINADIDFLGGLNGMYDDDSRLDLYLAYKLQNRDLLSTIQTHDDFIPIENRFENRFSPRINLGLKILKNLNASLSFNLTNMIINKSYKTPVEDLELSKMQREFHEFQLGMLTDLYYYTDRFSIATGITYTTRSEENLAYEKYDISEIEADKIKDLERQRDNISSRTRLYVSGKFLPSTNDTIDIFLSSGKYRYDTPSDENYDDRDELSFTVSASYMRRLNKSVAAGLFVETKLLHLVFLHSQRSAMNNWNRILRLGPEIKWTNRYFYVNPRFEILANYTAYDFDDLNDNIRSYSFRQIGYRDSICVYLSNSTSLQSRINVRYFERGLLYWDSFSESPQNSNLEYFLKLLVFTKLSNVVSIAAGVRTYSIEQNAIKDNNISTGIYSHFSWGPEAVFSLKFFDNSTISLQGWYEFQYINKLTQNKIPNIFLMTNLSL